MKRNYLLQDKDGISAKGIIGTTIVHALLLLLFFFLTLNAAIPKPEHQGLLINFGNSDAGMGEEQPVSEEPPVVEEETAAEEVEESVPEPQQPEKQTPKPIAENKTQTAKNTDAPALPEKDLKKNKDPKKTETKKPVKKPKPKPKPTKPKPKPKPKKPKADKPVTKPKEPVKKDPEVNKDALFKGSKSKSGGQGTSGSKNEDLGSKMGDVKITSNTGDTPSGVGKGGIGFSLSGRRALSLPKPQDNSQEVGKVVIAIKVDKNGKVIEATYTSSGSTTANANLRRKAIEAAKKAKFNTSLNAPEIQTGTISYTFSVR